MFKKIFIEICGSCNARCKYCCTGRAGHSSLKSYMMPQVFGKTIELLQSKSIANLDSIYELHNWGEPLLHPQFGNVIDVAEENRVRYGLSTNCSLLAKPGKMPMENMVNLVISIPGFSQESYSKIHGFSFKKIVANIDDNIKIFRNAGFRGDIQLSYHVYQFNLNEIQSAYEFAQERGMRFSSVCAFINDFDVAIDYLTMKIEKELLREIGKDLLLFYIDDLIKSNPIKYYCPQYDILSIDENCNVLTCCFLPKTNPEYAINTLERMSMDQIGELKLSRSVCKQCVTSGLAYWVHNPRLFNVTLLDVQEDIKLLAWKLFKQISPRFAVGTVKKIYHKVCG